MLALLTQLVRWFLVAGVVSLAACATKESTAPPSAGGVAAVTVAPATASIPVGQTVQLTATTKDAAGNVLVGQAVTWASSAMGVATVSGSGLVSGVAAGGPVTITATSAGQSGTAAVTVTGGTPSGNLVFTAVSTGSSHTCALTTTGVAYCWGRNEWGQLGSGPSDVSTTVPHPRPLAVVGGHTFAALSERMLGVHTCGLTPNGAAYCWGADYSGQLGIGTFDSDAHPTPGPVSGGLAFTQVSAGLEHACGRIDSLSQAYCWGRNEAGELGNGTTTNSSTPGAVSGGLTFAAVSSGSGFTCGVTTSGAAYCWGGNSGRLGNGSFTDQHTPVPVSGGFVFAAVSAGGDHACGQTTNGAAYCWGDGRYGQLGNGTTTFSNTPTAVAGGFTFSAVSAGFSHTCARTSNGVAYCWGSNQWGQLGNGTTTDRPVPVVVSGGLSFAAVSAGGDHTCGRTTNGTVYCWGFNPSGQLGDGTTNNSSVPVVVVGQASGGGIGPAAKLGFAVQPSNATAGGAITPAARESRRINAARRRYGKPDGLDVPRDGGARTSGSGTARRGAT